MNESFNPSRRGRGQLSRAWLRVALGSLGFALFAPMLPAQTNTTPSLSSNRWLLVVDTSRAMHRRADGVRRAAAVLLLTGMNGQMRRGDTVGLWTYDEELHAGKFPVQTWTPENRRDLARRVFTFLQSQKFQKESRLDRVVPNWNVVISNSAILTIVLISGGEEKIQGTPFDDAINDVYDGWREEQEKARMPFLTFLRAEHGRITNQKVNMPPGPLELPALPPEPQVVKVPDKVAPVVIGQPLIVSGRKPASTQTQDVSQPLKSSTTPATLSTNSPPPETEEPSTAPETRPPPASASIGEVPIATAMADTGATVAEPAAQPGEKPGEPSASLASSPAETETLAPPASTPEGAPATSAPATVAEAQPKTPAGPVHAATATLPETSVQPNALWIGALGLIGISLVLIGMMLRRSRSPAPASLITRSLDRESK